MRIILNQKHYYIPNVHFRSSEVKWNRRSSIATNASCRIGDTNRGILFLGFWGSWFRLICHCHPSNRANSSRRRGEHQVPPSIATIHVIVITDLFRFNSFGSIHYEWSPLRCYCQPVGDGWAAKDGSCHGEWCHFCNVIWILNQRMDQRMNIWNVNHKKKGHGGMTMQYLISFMKWPISYCHVE